MSSPTRIAAMQEAIVTGNAQKAGLLLRAGVPAEGRDAGGHPFIVLAARFAQAEVFRLLLREGADIKTPELIEWAVDGDGGRGGVSREIVRTVLEKAKPPKGELDAALRVACVSCDAQVVADLLAEGADPNGYDEFHLDFPLLNAVDNEAETIVELLIKAGADPHRHPVMDLDEEDRAILRGSLPEHASALGNAKILALLEAAAA